jgi:Uma2 family endonuclease
VTAAEQWAPPAREWTTDDLDALPEDGVRRELVDGVLIVSPAPSTAHQTLIGRLFARLDEGCPDDYVVSQGVEVRVNRRRTFIPDLVVVNSDAASRHPQHYASTDVLLAGEVVSPSSKAFDRLLKPNLYAEAGIMFYWRIELEPELAVHTHRLGGAGYEKTGEFTGTLTAEEPWPMSFGLANLLPKVLRKG